MRARSLVAVSALILILILVAIFIYVREKKPAESQPQSTTPPATQSSTRPVSTTAPETDATNVFAHNLRLRKGPKFQVYVRWLRGQIQRTHKNVVPSFDDPDSFVLYVKTGVLRANIGDLSDFISSGGPADIPLKNIKLGTDGNQLKLTGTLHKIVPLPIELIGGVSAAPGGRIHVHVTKLDVLKIPVKGLLSNFHVQLSDLFHPSPGSGMEVQNNDIYLDTQKLLPAPHMHGELTTVRVVQPDIEEVFGKAETDVERVEQWRNFLRMRDGTLDFGRLTMHHVDLIMIDVSKDAWFDLDLVHYQTQLVNGYSRMTPQAGLQIFMPDLDQLPVNKANQNISIEWLKNRNLPPPPEVMPK